MREGGLPLGPSGAMVQGLLVVGDEWSHNDRTYLSNIKVFMIF